MLLNMHCRIIDTEYLTQNVASIVMDAPDIAAFTQAGQFLHIACGDALLLRRPISVADINGHLIKIVFAIKGAGTRWLSQRAVGETLDVLGPLGKGFDLTPGKLLLIGGGIGAPPMLLAAKQAAARHKASVCALLGFSCAKQAILLPEFTAACSSVELSTDDGSLGSRGFVTDLLRLKLERESFDGLLACGPLTMLRAVSDLADDYQIPCQVSLEERMGCGIGACLTCSCKTKTSYGEGYARVCADGPVFSSREVIWNET
jgi:dihydroorotate dehydrogenase electron transfer subunit